MPISCKLRPISGYIISSPSIFGWLPVHSLTRGSSTRTTESAVSSRCVRPGPGRHGWQGQSVWSIVHIDEIGGLLHYPRRPHVHQHVAVVDLYVILLDEILENPDVSAHGRAVYYVVENSEVSSGGRHRARGISKALVVGTSKDAPPFTANEFVKYWGIEVHIPYLLAPVDLRLT
ncbi:hypothetical protein SCP_0601700 [Sparassis crispa]|uniref:Uncharacterized protein n=1 Tax=Sparassis crispa TaxID=139825 RepID=A0A401GPR5_9APHY|nr:hypothetical protein SCP_0601700 [Sparassis crispa]GBE84192.1 hypothetical protein SCP_0601700 [Sparassis crispa]